MKSFKCKECNSGFNRKAHLQQHISSVHYDLRPFVCPECVSNDNLNENQDEKINQNQNQNQNQNKNKNKNKKPKVIAFRTEQHLKRHIQSFHIKKPFSCSYCTARFPTQEETNNHILYKHPEKTLSENTSLSDTYNALHPYICDVCFRRFATNTRLKSHNTMYHGPVARFQCNIMCPNQNDNNQILQTNNINNINENEENSHTTNFYICGKKFSSYKDLQKHVSESHAKSREDYTCPTCDKNFTCQSSLNSHIITHKIALEDRQLHECSYCQRRFTKYHGLKLHVNAVHLKIKPFTCQYCNLSFAYKLLLNRHLKAVHSIPTNSKISNRSTKPMKSITPDISLNSIDTQSSAEDSANSEPVSEKGSLFTIDLLSGANYENRQISCPVSNCKFKFFREYDLQRHLKSLH